MREILERIHTYSDQAEPELLVQLVEHIRPKKRKHPGQAIKNLEYMLKVLEANPEFSAAFSHYVKHLFYSHNPIHLYTDTGIMSQKGFFYETISKINHK
ncbi:MAG: hypothetical protein K9I94_13410, partial [Bacteroidales bacterium]|nr:hypothetical protein [Bacteroidales bacterium]